MQAPDATSRLLRLRRGRNSTLITRILQPVFSWGKFGLETPTTSARETGSSSIVVAPQSLPFLGSAWRSTMPRGTKDADFLYACSTRNPARIGSLWRLRCLQRRQNPRLSASTTGSVVDANLPAIVLGDKSTLVHEKCCPSGGQKVIVLVSIDEYRYERT